MLPSAQTRATLPPKSSPNFPSTGLNNTTGQISSEPSRNYHMQVCKSAGSGGFLASHGLLSTSRSTIETANPSPFGSHDQLICEMLMSPREVMNMRWMKHM